MDISVLGQMGRNTYYVPIGFHPSHIFMSPSSNRIPSFALTAVSQTASYLHLPKDELNVQKKLENPTYPPVDAMNQEIPTDKKPSSADLKVGLGMSKEIEDAFAKPVYKVKEEVKEEVSGLHASKRPRSSSGQGGRGQAKKKKTSFGAGLKFI